MYVKEHTAPYKYPRIVEFRDELPKTISGKIRRLSFAKQIRINNNKNGGTSVSPFLYDILFQFKLERSAVKVNQFVVFHSGKLLGHCAAFNGKIICKLLAVEGIVKMIVFCRFACSER